MHIVAMPCCAVLPRSVELMQQQDPSTYPGLFEWLHRQVRLGVPPGGRHTDLVNFPCVIVFVDLLILPPSDQIRSSGGVQHVTC